MGHQALTAGDDVGAAEHVLVDGLLQAHVDVIGQSGAADGGDAAVQGLSRPAVAQQGAVGHAELVIAVAQRTVGQHQIQVDMAVDEAGQNGVPGQVEHRVLRASLGQDLLIHLAHILHDVLIELVLNVVKDIEAVLNGRRAGTVHDAHILQIGT